MAIRPPGGAPSSVVGQASLAGGTVTVLLSTVTATSRVFLTRAKLNGTPGDLSLGSISPGVSFVINSSSVLDTSTVNWMVL